MLSLAHSIDRCAGELNGGAPLSDMFCWPLPSVRVRDWRIIATAGGMPAESAIVVPTRNEAARLAACLEHCRRSIRASGASARLVVLINNSSDDSVGVATAWAARQGMALDLVEVELAEGQAHAGAARRVAFDIGRQCVKGSGVLMTTDADSRPERDWVRANLRAVAAGAALVCGRVALDAEEAAALPVGFLGAWAVEETYERASRELGSLLDPDPYNPWPNHGQISGASLAISARAYDAVGGAPVLPFGEDRALAARIRAFDLPIRFCDAARVVTSCRLDGRASGGMADTIRARVMDADLHCDDRLEPALATGFRARLRARLRRDWDKPDVIDGRLRRLGLDAHGRQEVFRHRHFGAAWASIEATVPALRRVRLERAQLAGELPLLQRLVADARARYGFATTCDPSEPNRAVPAVGEALCS
jgi:GT2 family glycosyltransferase